MPKSDQRDLASLKIRNEVTLLKELREREEELRRRRGLRVVHPVRRLARAPSQKPPTAPVQERDEQQGGGASEKVDTAEQQPVGIETASLSKSLKSKGRRSRKSHEQLPEKQKTPDLATYDDYDEGFDALYRRIQTNARLNNPEMLNDQPLGRLFYPQRQDLAGTESRNNILRATMEGAASLNSVFSLSGGVNTARRPFTGHHKDHLTILPTNENITLDPAANGP